MRETSQKISGILLAGGKSKRMGRNPRTGEEAVIAERKVVTFKPSKIFRNIVCDEDAGNSIED